jgi:hypothetical protein
VDHNLPPMDHNSQATYHNSEPDVAN